mmetsp:Transcript_11076/g.68198  ORF Transcript_11076/g.68198 Transcript_11076/m.68198 type:complete len:119 (-) Transcript_11076:2763-3119(-)
MSRRSTHCWVLWMVREVGFFFTTSLDTQLVACIPRHHRTSTDTRGWWMVLLGGLEHDPLQQVQVLVRNRTGSCEQTKPPSTSQPFPERPRTKHETDVGTAAIARMAHVTRNPNSSGNR